MLSHMQKVKNTSDLLSTVPHKKLIASHPKKGKKQLANNEIYVIVGSRTPVTPILYHI
jgi:hypothetical protein